VFDRRKVIVVNPEPVMTRPANPELPFDAATFGRCDKSLRAHKERLDARQDVSDQRASGNRRGSSKAVVAWTQIPEIWAVLERRFA
jgi:hypothetical protein